MNEVLIEIKLSEELKNKAETVLSHLGLTIPEALELFLKDVATTDKLPFKIPTTKKANSKAEILKLLEQELADRPLEVVDY